MEQQESLVKALEKSLDFERKGSEFYIKLGIDTRQALAKNLFYNLARQEINHIIRIEEIFNAIKRDAPWPEVSARKISEIENEMKKVFDKLGKHTRKVKLDNLEGYRLAIDMEKQGYEMYKEFSKKAIDEREKQFFAAMTEEEKTHLEALDNVYYFLTESKDWLSVEESKVWNWMSI